MGKEGKSLPRGDTACYESKSNNDLPGRIGNFEDGDNTVGISSLTWEVRGQANYIPSQ